MSAGGFIPTSKSFVELLSRWGGKLTNLGGLYRGILPVVVVDRFRAPDEANIWVIESETVGAPNEFSACGITNTDPTVDWELLAVSVVLSPQFTENLNIDPIFQIVTPLVGAINPVGNNLLSPFIPGLITDLSTTLSPLIGFSGTAVGIAVPIGEVHRIPQRSTTAGPFEVNESKEIEFHPPLRFYGERGCIVQLIALDFAVLGIGLRVSWRYRIRPKRLAE